MEELVLIFAFRVYEFLIIPSPPLPLPALHLATAVLLWASALGLSEHAALSPSARPSPFSAPVLACRIAVMGVYRLVGVTGESCDHHASTHSILVHLYSFLIHLQVFCMRLRRFRRGDGNPP